MLSLAATLGHRRIEARHLVDNAGSGRVLAKLGFRRIGRMVAIFSPARGEAAPALVHTLDLSGEGESGDDGNGKGSGSDIRRKAA
nr:GNAT family protein [Novosphingobium sp. 9]